MRLENKNAIVTGAAKGMGAAITLTLAREGADLVLTARDTAALDEVAGQVRALGRRAEVVAADVTDDAQVAAMAERAKTFFGGRIDILVNVAGVTGPIETPAWEIAAEDFSYVIESNIRGTFLPIKHVIPAMIAQRGGKIVNIGGTSGTRGYKYRAAYSASKWGVRGLTRTVALDAGEYGVNVNVVMPGIVETPRMQKLCEEKAPGQRRKPQHHRPGTDRRRRLGRLRRARRGYEPCTRTSNWRSPRPSMRRSPRSPQATAKLTRSPAAPT
jgi:3-oxoacyl-[acyl-carrier protein] reductase